MAKRRPRAPGPRIPNVKRRGQFWYGPPGLDPWRYDRWGNRLLTVDDIANEFGWSRYQARKYAAKVIRPLLEPVDGKLRYYPAWAIRRALNTESTCEACGRRHKLVCPHCSRYIK